MKTIAMVFSVVLLGLSIAAIFTGSLLFPEFLHTKKYIEMFFCFLGVGLGCVIFSYYLTVSKVWIVEDVGLYRNEVSDRGRNFIYVLYIGVLTLSFLLSLIHIGYYMKVGNEHKNTTEQVEEMKSEDNNRFDNILQSLKPSEG